MSFKATTDVSDKLISKFQSLEITRKRMDKLFKDGVIYKRDIDYVYEGIFLNAVTSFESYLESLFIGTLYGKYRFPTRRNLSKVNFPTKKIVTDIIHNSQSYVDWMPYDRVEKRAKIYFDEGFPFTNLNPVQKNFLTQIVAIRNAIAHKSPYSDDKFKKQVINNTPGLPQSNKTPAGYLRYVYRRGPEQTKFENYVMELSGIAEKIATGAR